MASMDNLRDKIRSRRADTTDLDVASAPAPAEVLSQTYSPVSQSNTDSLISEIFAAEDKAAANPFAKSETESKKAPPRKAPKAEPKEKSGLNLAFLNRFKQLEVNRKMLIISLSVAALASFLSMTYLNSIADPLKNQSRMVKVISIKKDVPVDTLITEEMLEIKEMPAAYLPQGALEYKPNMPLIGQKTVASLYKGEILIGSRISMPDVTKGDIAVQIPVKHRAMEIRAKNVSLAHASTPQQSQYVDLVASIPDPNPARQGKVIPYTILQRAMVLKVGSGVEGSISSSSAGDLITLAIPDDHVNLMILLQDKGNFTVVSRQPTDESTIPEKYTVQEIENALQGHFDAPNSSASKAEPVASKPETQAAAPVPQAPLVDLSGGTPARSYRAPARTYTPPARSYTPPARSYRAPARSTARAAKPAARPAAPRAATPAAPVRRPKVSMPRMTIQGGSVTQGGN